MTAVRARGYGRATSTPEPTPPPGSSLLARLGWAAKDKLFGRGDEERSFDAVKLVHADELRGWERFPRCQEFDGITYGEYRAQAYRLERRRRSVADLIKARERLSALDTGEDVEYASRGVEVPRRALLRRTVRLPLPEEPRAGARVECSEGRLVDGELELRAGLRSRWVWLKYRGPSRLVHAEQIEELSRLLGSMSEEQRRTIEEVATSRYAQPVLFVSHRWEDPAHPDPSGAQLRALRTLEDCFLVYDYTSFPQPPRTEGEEADFRQMLGAMDEIISNVVVLEAADYLTRGWCVYEYIVSSLRRTTVCDEVRDERFVTLRDWASTPPPVSFALRDSYESQQQNFINERILAAVSEVLPVYRDAHFIDEHDEEVVTRLLLEHLKRALPPIKESQQYLGEWRTIRWTDETLMPVLMGEAELPRLESGVPIRRFDTAVPSSLGDAVRRRYAIEQLDWKQLLNPMGSLIRTDFKAIFSPRRRG